MGALTLEKERPKLSIREQVECMRDEKGIGFSIIGEEEAIEFLTNHSYYFKLKAYEKNYSKGTGENKEKYCDLEFAYLKELSLLDMYLRKIILDITLDIEHFLKVKVLRVITEDNDEDGYVIVKNFLCTYPDIDLSIRDKIEKKTSYVSDLTAKYIDDLPIWVFFELITFGQFITFCEFYESKRKKKDSSFKLGIDNIYSVKHLRNASAHNNCLINNLGKRDGLQISRQANSFVAKIKDITPTAREKKMSNRFIRDFVTTLIVFNNVVTSDGVKEAKFRQLKELLDIRFTKHADYFEKNALLVSNYLFVKKIIDKLYEKAYNNNEAQKNFR